MKYGYWVDLNGKQFGASSWIQALPIGEYEHPVYGKMSFTPERIRKFAQSVNNKVRGIDPDIDYDHKAHHGKAAGWVRAADVRGDGLYLQVDWTDPATAAIQAGEYRYFSPEFDDKWTDPNGTEHEDVLFGGALTNRPFLKDLLPVNLSEITTTKKATEGGRMDPEQLRQLLGLGKDASDSAVEAKIKELAAGPPAPPTPPTPPEPTVPEPTPEPALTGAALSEAIAKALAENPMLKQMQEQITQTQNAHRLAEVKERLSKVSATQAGRQYVLPPSVIDTVAQGMTLSDPAEMGAKFVEALEAFGQTGFVELGERGRTRNGVEKTASQQLSELVTKAQAQHMQTTGKALSQVDAIRQVCSVNPELYLAYRSESYAGREE
jgi:phage I-like protein